MSNYNDVRDHVESLVKGGYLAKNHEPLKCSFCEGKKFYEKSHTNNWNETVISRICVNCNNDAGYHKGNNWMPRM